MFKRLPTEYRKKHESCCILASGPSIDLFDIDKLRRDFDIIAVTEHCLSDELLFDFYVLNHPSDVLLDPLIVDERGRENCLRFLKSDTWKYVDPFDPFLDYIKRNCIVLGKNTFFLTEWKGGGPIERTGRGTVTRCATQIGLYLQYKEVYILGMDFSDRGYAKLCMHLMPRDTSTSCYVAIREQHLEEWTNLCKAHPNVYCGSPNKPTTWDWFPQKVLVDYLK